MDITIQYVAEDDIKGTKLANNDKEWNLMRVLNGKFHIRARMFSRLTKNNSYSFGEFIYWFLGKCQLDWQLDNKANLALGF